MGGAGLAGDAGVCVMTAAQIANVAHIHAEYLLQARRLEASADRHEGADPDRASQARDDAAQCRAKASALAALLQAAGAQVLIPEPGQLSLFGDGQ
jgi:phosphomannomutase